MKHYIIRLLLRVLAMSDVIMLSSFSALYCLKELVVSKNNLAQTTQPYINTTAYLIISLKKASIV